jgi:hypothetical protein
MVLSGQKSPFMFPLEKCQQAATSPNQSILFCPINGSPHLHLRRRRQDFAFVLFILRSLS